MMGPGRFGDILNRETIKPRNLSETLGRLGGYFGRFWYMIALAVLFVIISTWTQVTTPELTGQATDCFLVPLGQSAFEKLSPAAPSSGSGTTGVSSNCWLGTTADPSTLSYSRQIIYHAYHLGGYVVPDVSTATTTQRIGALFRLILVMLSLFVTGALVTGSTFFAMAWTGQHVLRELRLEVFEKLHSLSLSYYAEHEAGDLMSRITNDSSAIEQAFSFALVQVFGGALTLVWVAYNMLTSSLPFALLSLSVAPLMFITTLWFSAQASKAFRRSREEIGNVNAELQETISSVREVQAFNRADENIEQFKEVNAANRDANVRPVA